MRKLILFLMLAVGLAFAQQNCSYHKIETFKNTHHMISCTDVDGYDSVVYNVWVYFDSLDFIQSIYFIDGIKQKSEFCGYGTKIVKMYDEFQVKIEETDTVISEEKMKQILLNKWNEIKKLIKKTKMENKK